MKKKYIIKRHYLDGSVAYFEREHVYTSILRWAKRFNSYEEAEKFLSTLIPSNEPKGVFEIKEIFVYDKTN